MGEVKVVRISAMRERVLHARIAELEEALSEARSKALEDAAKVAEGVCTSYRNVNHWDHGARDACRVVIAALRASSVLSKGED